MPMPSTLEGQLVRLADRLGYVNHDIDDAIRAGLLAEKDLPEEAVSVLGRSHAERIETLVTDIVETSMDAPEVRLSEPASRALDVLRQFMFDRVYLREEAGAEQEKAIGVVRGLFSYYLDHLDDVPPEYHAAPGDPPTRVADYIAGMTDRYALREYARLFLPRGWML
jgi:dGTPase